jgi:hypothetical protein
MRGIPKSSQQTDDAEAKLEGGVHTAVDAAFAEIQASCNRLTQHIPPMKGRAEAERP